MKPGERIMQISKEMDKKDPISQLMGGMGIGTFIRTQAVLEYLDEEWEKNKKS